METVTMKTRNGTRTNKEFEELRNKPWTTNREKRFTRWDVNSEEQQWFIERERPMQETYIETWDIFTQKLTREKINYEELLKQQFQQIPEQLIKTQPTSR